MPPRNDYDTTGQTLNPVSLYVQTPAGDFVPLLGGADGGIGAVGDYETLAAGQTAQPLGAAGAAGDFLDGLLVIPATTSPGLVTVLDGATSIPVFAGGADSVGSLIPFFIPIGAIALGAGWKVTTGANVSVLAIGRFT